MTEKTDLSFQGGPEKGSAVPPETPPASPATPAEEPGKQSEATPPAVPEPALSDEQTAAMTAIAQSAADKAVSARAKQQKDQVAAAAETSRLAEAQRSAGEKAAYIRTITILGEEAQEAAGIKITAEDTVELAMIAEVATQDKGTVYLEAIDKAIAAKRTRLAIAPEQHPPEETPEEGEPAGNANRAAVGLSAGSVKANPLANVTDAKELLNKAFTKE